jgi:hypothetical protein
MSDYTVSTDEEILPY